VRPFTVYTNLEAKQGIRQLATNSQKPSQVKPTVWIITLIGNEIHTSYTALVIRITCDGIVGATDGILGALNERAFNRTQRNDVKRVSDFQF
jgi:hypothetical protein